MIELKRVEIRDRATLIPALAMKICACHDPIVARGGYPECSDRDYITVILIDLNTVTCAHEPFAWTERGGRTMYLAHSWLRDHWTDHKDGAVLDVEFISGETSEPKKSEL